MKRDAYDGMRRAAFIIISSPFILYVLAALVGFSGPVHAAEEHPPIVLTNSALILYDGPATSGEGLLLARHTANLMGHFGFKPEVKPMSDYAPGLADGFRALFVCGMTDGAPVPAALLEDVARRDAPTVWIYLHPETLTALTNAAAKLGFTYVENDDEANLTMVNYHGFKLPRSDYAEIDRVNITQPAKVRVLATAETEDQDEDERTPYVLRSG